VDFRFRCEIVGFKLTTGKAIDKSREFPIYCLLGQNFEFVSKGIWVTFHILPILRVFTQYDNQAFVPSQSRELLNSIHDAGLGSVIVPGE